MILNRGMHFEHAPQFIPSAWFRRQESFPAHLAGDLNMYGFMLV